MLEDEILAELTKPVQEKPVKPAKKVEQEPFSDELVSFIHGLKIPKEKRYIVVYAPSGKCPFSLKPTSDKDDVKKFCEEIVEYGLSQNKLYTPSVIRYWAGRQIDFSIEKNKTVKQLIENWIKEVCSETCD